MSLKSEQKQRSYGAIVASACSLLRGRGIAGTKVAEVMEGAGLTVGGFYAHFASKEALVDEALRTTAREMRDGLFVGTGQGVGVDQILRRYLSALHRDEPDRGCPLPAVVGEVGTSAKAHAPVLGAQIEAMARGVGEATPEHTVLTKRHLALGLVALMYGGLALARATAGTPLSDDILRACRALGRDAARGAHDSIRNVTKTGEKS